MKPPTNERRIPPLLLLLPLLALLALGGCGGGASERRIILLGLDGVDPDVVDLLVTEGRLPNFARLKREGAYGRLHSPPPLLSPIIWTTIATGRLPGDHGIGHFTTVDPTTGEELPVTSSMRRTRALWNIFSERERQVAVVGWWATWPAEPVRGVMVSDHTAYHFLLGHGLTEGPSTRWVTHPERALDELAEFVRPPQEIGADELRGFVDVDAEELAGPFAFGDDLSHFRWALGAAETYRDIGLHLWRSESPDLLLVYIEGVDTTSHLFGHLYRQQGLAGELARQQRRFGMAVERMYEFADSVVGDYLEAMDERTTLIVVSDHGFQLGELPTDPSKTRDMRRVSEAYHREYGILFLYGAGVPPGTRIAAAETIDLTPTVLALAGLPPAADMPGKVLVPVSSASLPRIASYEPEGGRAATATARDARTDSQVLEHLQSLGYIGSSDTTTNDRNLASILLREGRYEEAITAFRRLVEADAEDPVPHAALGTALAEVGREDEALAEFARAIELDPLNVSAYHNRGLLYEKLGRRDEAIADYRTALRYRGDHAPSRRALERLGVGIVGRTADTAEQRRAAELLEEASDLLRRGDYDKAGQLVQQARELAPDSAAVYHAEANVAYLRGDRDAAVAALEHALELEPDNALFRENLRRLRAGD